MRGGCENPRFGSPSLARKRDLGWRCDLKREAFGHKRVGLGFGGG